MHYSAKRGIKIACRPSVRLSVRPSVTLVDQDYIAGKPWKLIARTISPAPSLFVAQRPSTYVIDFGTNRKRVCDVLLVVVTLVLS